MVYREDEEAARARADALQVDLDRSEAELASTKAKLAATEEQLAAAREGRTIPKREPFAELPPVPRTSDRWDGLFVGLLLVLIAWVAIYALTR